MKTRNLIIGLALVAFIGVGQAAGSTIEIQLAGLDIEYDGLTVQDAGGSNPADAGSSVSVDADSLDTVNYLVDGELVGSFNRFDSSLYADFEFVPVEDIPVDGGTIHTGLTSGHFDLLIPDIGLDLDLNDAWVIYTPVPNTSVAFVFAGSIATISDQNLPLGLVIGDPVQVSFSTQVEPETVTHDPQNEYVTGFSASGTGEITGQLIPEPSTLILLAIATLGFVVRRKRSR